MSVKILKIILITNLSIFISLEFLKSIDIIHFEYMYSYGNFFGVIIASSSLLLYKKVNDYKKQILGSFFVMIGFAFYEFMQIILPYRTFDINDLIASILGCLLFILMALLFCILSKVINKLC